MHWLTGGSSKLEKRETVDGIFIHRFGKLLLPHFAHIIFLLRNRDADVIVDDLAHAIPWLSPWFSKIPGVAHFYHLHARTLNGQTSRHIAPLISTIEKRYGFIYKSWPFVAFSSSSASDLHSVGIERNRVIKIPLGVDTDLFRPGIKSERPTIVYFGGMRPYKRPDHVLLLLRTILEKGHDVMLYMIGDGPSLPHLRVLARRLRIEKNISFFGKVSDSTLSSLISQAWVNVHCSISEGWGLSIIEAAACGVPTAAYKVPGVVESVKDGTTGILVRDGDIDALSDSVCQLLFNSTISSAQCQAYARVYSWSVTASLWEKILKKAAEPQM